MITKELKRLRVLANEAMDVGKYLLICDDDETDHLLQRLNLIVRDAFCMGMDHQKQSKE